MIINLEPELKGKGDPNIVYSMSVLQMINVMHSRKGPYTNLIYFVVKFIPKSFDHKIKE